MCRHLAYLGEPVTLASVLLDPPYSLLVQAHAPRHQAQGRINADGIGAGWYAPDVRATPARYRKPVPMWTDQTFANIAGAIRSGAFLASVRNASPGLPVNEACTAPYTRDVWLFSHNGFVANWRGADGTGVALRRQLSDASLAAMEGATDSEVLFGLVLDRIAAGATPPSAVASVVHDTLRVAPDSRLNLLLTDGTSIVATVVGNSLFTRHGDGATVVASEPFDDAPGWQQLDDSSLVVADRNDLTVGAIT